MPRREFLVDAIEFGCTGGGLRGMGIRGREVMLQRGQSRFDPRHGGIDLGEICGGGGEPEGPQPVGHLPPTPGTGGLVPHRFEPARYLAHDVGEPLAILFGAFETPQRLGAPGLEASDARGLLEDGTTVLA